MLCPFPLLCAGGYHFRCGVVGASAQRPHTFRIREPRAELRRIRRCVYISLKVRHVRACVASAELLKEARARARPPQRLTLSVRARGADAIQWGVSSRGGLVVSKQGAACVALRRLRFHSEVFFCSSGRWKNAPTRWMFLSATCAAAAALNRVKR